MLCAKDSLVAYDDGIVLSSSLPSAEIDVRTTNCAFEGSLRLHVTGILALALQNLPRISPPNKVGSGDMKRRQGASIEGCVGEISIAHFLFPLMWRGYSGVFGKAASKNAKSLKQADGDGKQATLLQSFMCTMHTYVV